MDSMKARLLTAAIGVPLAVVVLIFGERFNLIMYILTSVLSLIMVFELLSARKLHNNLTIFIPCAVYAIVQPLILTLKLGYFPMFVFVLIMFLIMIVNGGKVSYNDLSFAILGELLIVLGLSSILMLAPSYDHCYTIFFVLCIGIPWCADAGAYFTGVFLGKHKLCPRISPNKTVEGFIGGLIAGIISAAIIGFIYTFLYQKAHFNFFVIMLIGLCASLVSVLGDLSFSLIKRSCNIKDYGSIFPGHGGFLDRFDSVIFASPIVFFIGKAFIIFSF